MNTITYSYIITFFQNGKFYYKEIIGGFNNMDDLTNSTIKTINKLKKKGKFTHRIEVIKTEIMTTKVMEYCIGI